MAAIHARAAVFASVPAAGFSGDPGADQSQGSAPAQKTKIFGAFMERSLSAEGSSADYPKGSGRTLSIYIKFRSLTNNGEGICFPVNLYGQFSVQFGPHP